MFQPFSSFTWQLTEASTSFVCDEQEHVVTIRCPLSEWDISPVHSNAHPTAHYNGLRTVWQDHCISSPRFGEGLHTEWFTKDRPVVKNCHYEEVPEAWWKRTHERVVLCAEMYWAATGLQSLPVLAPMTHCIGMLAPGTRQLTALTSVNKLIAGDWRTTQSIQGNCSLQLQQ